MYVRCMTDTIQSCLEKNEVIQAQWRKAAMVLPLNLSYHGNSGRLNISYLPTSNTENKDKIQFECIGFNK